MSTLLQEKDFKKAMAEELPLSLLGTAIDWIRDNMNPDQVFATSALRSFISNTCQPDEVFSDEELKKWAEGKGFAKKGCIKTYICQSVVGSYYQYQNGR